MKPTLFPARSPDRTPGSSARKATRVAAILLAALALAACGDSGDGGDDEDAPLFRDGGETDASDDATTDAADVDVDGDVEADADADAGDVAPDAGEDTDPGDTSDDAVDTTTDPTDADATDATTDVADTDITDTTTDPTDTDTTDTDTTDTTDAADTTDAPLDTGDADVTTDADVPDGPLSAIVGYTVLSRGGTYTAVGTEVADATALTVGGVAQSFTVVDGALEFTLDDATPLGAADVVAEVPGGEIGPLSVTVVDLHVAEVDVDSPDATGDSDSSEFVEVWTGLTDQEVDLTGYTVVLLAGGAQPANELPAGRAYLAVELTATTTDGLLVVGDTRVSPAIDWGLDAVASHMINSYNAVALYQGPAADWAVVCPEDVSQIQNCGGNVWTPTGLLDAVVYKGRPSDDDRGTFAGMLEGDPVLVEGDTSGERSAVSFTWCDGAGWFLEAPSPGAVNECD